MANVLSEEKKQQVLALGRLGWSLRQIQTVTHIRRETASQYLKAAGIAVRPPGGWGRWTAKPANEVITDFGAGKAAKEGNSRLGGGKGARRGNTPPKQRPKKQRKNQNPPHKGKTHSKPA